MMNRWGGILLLLGAYFFVPMFVAKVPMGASWKSLFIAYGVWIALLAILGLTSTKTWGDAIGRPLIMALFFTVPAIALFVFCLEAAGIS